MFIAPENSIISVKTSDSEWEERNITAADTVQCIEIEGTTSRFELKTSSPKLVGLGVWLDGESGVSLDCMSSRGFSGITLTKINPTLCREMATEIDYNLIILEFGINAMSSSQKDYSIYSGRMVEVINHVRKCYPRADILVMGVGDRGEKRGGVVRSMATAPAMINAQRDAARRAHCLFWDTREAMGGEDAVVQWCDEGLINKDYIHMTHKGAHVWPTPSIKPSATVCNEYNFSQNTPIGCFCRDSCRPRSFCRQSVGARRRDRRNAHG